ncbi:flippase [Hungatella hathewayi]|nr:flippase [Hungatella hathewayi]
MKMNSIKKNFIYNSIYQLLVIAMPLITTPYISRVLGANGIGVYSYSYSVSQYYVLFIMLGLNNYGNRTIASIRNDKKLLKENFWSIYFMQLFLGISVSLIYFIYCFSIARNTFAALIMSIYVISACFDINWFLFGMEMFKATVIRNTLIKVLTTACIFIFVRNAEDVYTYCLIMVMGIFLSQIALWPYIKKIVPFYFPSFSEIKVHIKPNLVLFLTVIAVSLYKIMDKIMLGMLSNTSQVGFYESAERIILIPTSLITSLGTVMLPRMTNMFATEKNSDKTKNLLYKSIVLAAFLSSSMAAGIMGVSKEFIPIFYGSGYEECINLFLILLPSCFFLGFGNVLRTQYLIPKKLDKIYVTSAFFGAVTNLIVNSLLIPKYFAVGAAVGTLLSEIVVCVYQSYMIRKKVELGKYIFTTVPFLVSSVVMFLIIYNFNSSDIRIIGLLFLKIVIGVLIYIITLLLQAFIYTRIRKISIKELIH